MGPIYSLVLHSLAYLLFLDVTTLSAQESRITEVVIYHSAPGQFMGSKVIASKGVTTYQELLRQAQRILVQDERFLSLGERSGYIIIRVQPALINRPNQADFAILDNTSIGNTEPGAIHVSQDTNGSGLADDLWYHIRDNEDYRSNLNYTITYYRPKDPYDDPVAWSDSKGDSELIPRNKYHTINNYYPPWGGDRVTFSGVRLPGCTKQEHEGDPWESQPYAYGYAGNHPNGSLGSYIDIDSAVNVKGELVQLDRTDFLEMQTGVHQQIDETGGVPTESVSIKSLAKGTSIISPTIAAPTAHLFYSDNQLYVEDEVTGMPYLYDTDGQFVLTHPLSVSSAAVALSAMSDYYVTLLRLEGGAFATYRIYRQ